jgi:tripartite-type tricarboxylate transporter receptor subunit TctC
MRDVMRFVRHWRLPRFVQARACVVATLAACCIAAVMCEETIAQGPFPNRPIRIIVGEAPGGPSDILLRALATRLNEPLGQPVIIENRPGASGIISAETAARAEPDGHTLMMVATVNSVNETLYKNLKYRFTEHFTAVAGVADTEIVLVVHPTLDVNSPSALAERAKAKPDEIFYATAGKGTATHLAAELFSSALGIKMTPVHYKGGGDALKDLISGQVKVMFSTIPPVLGLVTDGKLRGLATTGPVRASRFPELPTIAEAVLPGFEARLWIGLTAPKGTPRDVIDRLSSAIKTSLESDDMKKALATYGFNPLVKTPDEFNDFYIAETAKWGKIAPAIGIIGD